MENEVVFCSSDLLNVSLPPLEEYRARLQTGAVTPVGPEMTSYGLKTVSTQFLLRTFCSPVKCSILSPFRDSNKSSLLIN